MWTNMLDKVIKFDGFFVYQNLGKRYKNGKRKKTW